MNKQTIINRLEALDLSQYPYFGSVIILGDLTIMHTTSLLYKDRTLHHLLL